MNEKYALNLKDLVEFSYSLIYIDNYDKMTSLLDNSFTKNYYEYSKIIFNTLCSSKFIDKKIIFNKDIELTNPFNRILFVVQDKEALLKDISSKGYTISQGPKP
jgi:alpha-amylase/alpha-mannosidase (GH57 family)